MDLKGIDIQYGGGGGLREKGKGVLGRRGIAGSHLFKLKIVLKYNWFFEQFNRAFLAIKGSCRDLPHRPVIFRFTFAVSKAYQEWSCHD